MKKSITLLFLVTTLIVACKKDRTCSCTETKTGTSKTTGKASIELFPGLPQDLADTTFSSPLNETRSYDRVYKDAQKKAAKNNCLSYSEPFKETVVTSVPASSFQLSVIVVNEGTVSYDCKLK